MNTKCGFCFEKKFLTLLKQIASLALVPFTALGLINKHNMNCTLCRNVVTGNNPVAAQFTEPGTSVILEKKAGLVIHLVRASMLAVASTQLKCPQTRK